jgi:hypothetical protein
MFILLIKFIYSEKATKFCEISNVDLSYVVMVKSTVENSQNFVAFSEKMNFTIGILDRYVMLTEMEAANQACLSMGDEPFLLHK